MGRTSGPRRGCILQDLLREVGAHVLDEGAGERAGDRAAAPSPSAAFGLSSVDVPAVVIAFGRLVAVEGDAQVHRVSARAPRQPSEASRAHFPIVQVCRTLSATQKPAPSLKGRPAQTQPLAGSGIITGMESNIGAGRGGVCWA